MSLTVARQKGICQTCRRLFNAGDTIDFVIVEVNGEARNKPIHGVCPPPSGSPSPPSPSPAPSAASPTPVNVSTAAAVYETSISVERSTEAPPGFVGGHVLIRLQSRVTGTNDAVGSEILKIRKMADYALMEWSDEVYPPAKVEVKP